MTERLHDFYLNEDGEIDTWRLDVDYHSGPQCRRCRRKWCVFCVERKDYDFRSEACDGEDD